MELRIVSAEKSQIFSIAWVEANTPVGNFVIQDGHAPMVLALSPGKQLVFQLKSGKKESLTVENGMLEVHRTSATVLLRS